MPAFVEGARHVFGRHHAAQDGVVRPLDARNVHEAGRATHQGAAGKAQFRDRLPATLGDGASPIGDPAPAREGVGDHGMRLEALELVEGRQGGVLVVQVDHEAHRDEVVLHAVEERAAAGAVAERPSEGMLHEPGPMRRGRHLPQLLEADAVFLRIASLVELEAADQALGERAARPLGDEHIFGPKLHAARVGFGDGAVAPDPHVARRHADHLARVAVENLDGRETRIDVDPERFRLAAEEARHIGQRADEVAMVAHQLRHQGTGEAHAAGRPEIVEAVVRHFELQRAILGRAPLGQEGVEADRVHDDAGEDVGADFRALFQHHDGEVGLELFQPDGGRETGRAGPDHHDVELHGLAGRRLEGLDCAVTVRHGGAAPRPNQLVRYT